MTLDVEELREPVDLLDRSLGQEERLGDRCVLPFGHLEQDVALAGRQLGERRALGAGALSDERLDNLRIDHRATLRDRVDGGDEVIELIHPLFQEVGATRRPAFQEREQLARARVLAELEASTGAEALRLADELLPDVILMDLRLPDMDGSDVARRLGAHASRWSRSARSRSAPATG